MKKNKPLGISRREFMKTSANAAAGTLLGVSAIGVFSEPVSAEAKKSVVLATTQEPVQFNPLLYVNVGFESIVEACVFDSLWTVNEKGEFVPNLAVKVPTLENGGISPDGKIWTVEIKKGIKWHDGAPFTAKDVEFTYKSIINPKLAVRSRSGFDLISDFIVKDDYNIEMRFEKIYVPFAWSWAIMHIVPHHILSKETDINTSTFNTNPIGTGPYIFKKRVAGSHLIYEKNKDYHRGAPKIDTFIHKFVPEQTIAYTQFKTGEIDILGAQGVPVTRADEAKNLPGRVYLPTPTAWVQFIYFNCGKPQFKDKAVRQALYTAIDIERYLKDVYYDLNPPSLSYLAPSHWAYNNTLKAPGYNPRNSAEMLDAVGWKIGSDGVREKNGVKLKFTMSTTAGNRAREQAQALFQQNWKEIGVQMEIKNMPGSVVWGEYTQKSKFDTLLVSWAPPVGIDPEYSARCHSKQIPVKYGTGANYTQYENTELDKLLEEGVAVSDMEQRKQIYYKAQEILFEDLPFAPLHNTVLRYGRKGELKGHKINSYVPAINWNAYEWYWG